MSFEIAEAMNKEGALLEWASNVTYGRNLAQEEKEFSEYADQWARDLGKTGHDANHELAAMVQKAITVEDVAAPGELLGRMFDETAIGEFDDLTVVQEPKNTIQVHEAILEGNVDRSFVDHKKVQPTWITLAAETDIPMLDLRRNGYKTVVNYINWIKEALELMRVVNVLNAVDALIVSGQANYIAEATAAPTATSADALALYLQDVNDGGRPIAFMLNKYRQAMSKLAQADRWPVEADKNMYNNDGFLRDYAGMELLGFSGQKKLGDGSLIVPDKRVFGVGGKIGVAALRGETRVLEHEDINAERVHLKVTGFTYGFAITDITKMAKIVMAL